MCGIAGLWAASDDQRGRAVVDDMGARLIHRGPDDKGCWADPALGIALAHRRLAIAVARLLTVTRTCQLQQLNALAYLTGAIRCHRRRQAVESLLRKQLTP